MFYCGHITRRLAGRMLSLLSLWAGPPACAVPAVIQIRLGSLLLGWLLLLPTSGCATPTPRHVGYSAAASQLAAPNQRSSHAQAFYLEVDALAAPDARVGSYVIISGNANVAETDLEFRNYSQLLASALNHQGYMPAGASEPTDLVIALYYAIGDPEHHAYTWSEPIIGITGQASSHTAGTATSLGGSTNIQATTTHIPTYGVTGYRQRFKTETTYSRFLKIRAFDAKSIQADSAPVERWVTTVVSSGASSDLRAVVPYLIVGAMDHFGASTDSKVSVVIPMNDPRVNQLRGR